jgi:hypothetical protein
MKELYNLFPIGCNMYKQNAPAGAFLAPTFIMKNDPLPGQHAPRDSQDLFVQPLNRSTAMQ